MKNPLTGNTMKHSDWEHVNHCATKYVKWVGVDKAIDKVIAADPLVLCKYATASDDGSRLVGHSGLEKWSEEMLVIKMIENCLMNKKISFAAIESY
jgi:hypothetical protein